jgi:hypothetical protein
MRDGAGGCAAEAGVATSRLIADLELALAQKNNGMSEKTIAQKLGLKAGKTLLVRQQPDDIAALLGALPTGAELVTAGKKPCALILMFAKDQAALAKGLSDCKRLLEPGGALWVAYIKGTSARRQTSIGTAFAATSRQSASTRYHRSPSTMTGRPCV